VRVRGYFPVGGAGLHMLRCLEQQGSQIRHEVHRHHPRDHQRNDGHGKNGEGVLAGHRLGQANGQKTGGGDQGPRQHGHGGDLVGEGGGAYLVVALFQLAHHHLDGNDGVVHQEAQSDDERAQRDFVQADVPVAHGEEGDRQHQRNRDAHHQPRPRVHVPAAPPALRAAALVQTQADKADDQHDHHSLDQHADKLVHRTGNRLGLVLHVHQAHAGGQLRVDAGHGGVQGLAQRNDVAPLGHRNANRNHLLAVVPHLDGGRVHIAAPHLGNVGQAQLPARCGANRHGAQVFNGVELPLHAHLQLVGRRLHHAGTLHRVLLAELRQHLVHVEAELCQALLRDFDVQLFILHAKELHLGHVGHAQQLLAHVVGKGLGFGQAEAFGLQRVDHAIDIAKIVVEERPLHALRQGEPHIADLLAHGVPDARHLVRFGRILDLENDLRLARLRIAADLVGVLHFLQRALDLVGHLLGHLLRRGARPVGAHHHGTESEGRVFVLPELKVGQNTHQQQHHHQVAGQRRVVQRPLREVEPGCGLA